MVTAGHRNLKFMIITERSGLLKPFNESASPGQIDVNLTVVPRSDLNISGDTPIFLYQAANLFCVVAPTTHRLL